ncbi:Malonyl CoA-acyl carrier protein transacylase [Thalassoglobus neptunius]|uniref:Malonyl CoA-acyl carrier protein transacylase n=1 Tax=Thalassoglobus neptunius TaxID=1938619 RepID=A0A5C5X7F4_9PLAN|nr:ACP S-malonyltransferase [Thalassoglobus neptunius]TWT58193.1 Malonyl CoA-acyl carrier protein transacylase [Thalassoglobus neptunius]
MSRIGFLFPGQGAQHVGMGKQIVDQYPAADSLFDQASEILGYDLKKLCFEGPSSELDSTVYSQPAIFVTSLACLEKLRADSPDVILSCEVAAGLSLGEYTALVFAGAMSFEDGLRVVQQRGQAMQDAADATPSGMASVLMLDLPDVEKIRDEAQSAGIVEIANYLCPGNLVLSGENAAIELAVELAEKAGARVVPLAVAGAFHTEIMKPADDRLKKALSEVAITSPKRPVISNVDAQAHSDPDEIKDVLVRQVINPVRWEDSVRSMLESGVDEFYEIGPGRVLTGLLKRIQRKTRCTAINDS